MTNLNVKEYETTISGGLKSVTTIDNTKYIIKTGSELEPEKTATITANGTTTINPSSGYEGMAKAKVTVAVPATNPTYPVYRASNRGAGTIDQEDISDDYAILLFSDSSMTTPLDPTTLTSSDSAYLVWVAEADIRGYGIDDSLVGGSMVVSLLKAEVDVVDTHFIRFDLGEVSASESYVVIDQTSTPTQMTWLKALTTYRT